MFCLRMRLNAVEFRHLVVPILFVGLRGKVKPRRTMQTKQTLRGVKERNYIRRMLGGSILALAIFVLGFLIVPYLVAEASALQSVTVGANWVSTSLTFDPDYGNGPISDEGHGNITFGDIIPTSTTDDNIGTERVIKKTLGVESTGKYYTVYLSMSGDSNLLKLGGTDSNIKINPVAGTWDAPVAFSTTSWGYAVPGTSIPTSSSTWDDEETPEYPSFSQATTFSDISNLGVDITYMSNRSIYNTDTWVAVPVLGSAQQIWKAETNNNHGFGGEDGDSINNHFDIYYGIMVGSDTLAGTYENEIVYTALASMQAIDEISNNLLVAERYVAKDTEQTLKFDLASSTAGLIKPSQVYAYVVPHHEAIPNLVEGVLETDEEALARLQGNIASNSAYYDQCTFNRADNSTDIVFDTDGATITCSMPDKAPVWDGGLTNTGAATDGYFDIWITIPAYNANYISKTTEQGTDTRVASVVYAGLQSVDSNGDSIVTEMQEMTWSICKNTNTWGRTIGLNVTTSQVDLSAVHLYDYRGEDDGNEIMVGVVKDYSTGADADQIGTFELTDVRDDKTYWDPAETMYNYALNLANEEGYTGPAVTRSNYFEIASEDLLGVEQSYQFQPYGTTGYSWGTIYNEDGERIDGTSADKLDERFLPTNRSYMPNGIRNATITLASGTAGESDAVYVEFNSRADMPRSYDAGSCWTETQGGLCDNAAAYPSLLVGTYYNWMAATAGSGGFSLDDADSSICAKGWTLPGGTTGAGPRYQDFAVLRTVDGRAFFGSSWQISRAFPVEMKLYGDYRWWDGVRHYFGYGLFMSSSSRHTDEYGYIDNQYIDFAGNSGGSIHKTPRAQGDFCANAVGFGRRGWW